MKTRVTIEGIVKASVISPTGELVEQREKKNVFTDAGRNWLAHLISYAALTQPPGTEEQPSSKRRWDGIRYVMVGTGSQTQTAQVTGLNSPVPFNTDNHFLKQVQAPNELPSTGTSALFRAVFGLDELSHNGNLNITEAGLFPSGAEGNPLDITNNNYVPLAYVVFTTPLPKTPDYLLAIEWEIRF